MDWLFTLRVAMLACIVSAPLALAQTASPDSSSKPEGTASWKQRAERNIAGTVDVLSDTQGVDLNPYLWRVVVPTVRRNWFNVIPRPARKPVLQSGKVSIEFSILKDGQVTGMKLVLPSGDPSLDRAAWEGISASSPFEPLPKEFAGPSLTLRFHFLYNMEPSSPTGFSTNSSGIQSLSNPNIKVAIFPHPSMAVPVGASRVVSASVEGSSNMSVSWRITGPGCAASSCGRVSEGRYFAPSADELTRPLPLTLKLTAISEADPEVSASITVRIVRGTD
jgi:TonB family protein